MARIPEAEIERIKRAVSVERLVEASGVKLKRTGKDRARPIERYVWRPLPAKASVSAAPSAASQEPRSRPPTFAQLLASAALPPRDRACAAASGLARASR